MKRFALCLFPLAAACSLLPPTVRPVKPFDAPEARLSWPDFVPQDEVALLADAERTLADVRQGDLLLTVENADGSRAEGVQLRWEQTSRDVLFGVADDFDPGLWGDLVRAGVNHVESRLDWLATEPEKGSWRHRDTISTFGLDVLPGLGVQVAAVGAVWLVPTAMPDWALALEGEPMLRAVARHLEALVSRLRGHVAVWEALHDPTGSALPTSQLIALTGAAVQAIRDADPLATVVVSHLRPLGEARDVTPLAFMQRLERERIDVDAIGLTYTYNGYAPSGVLEPRHSLAEISANLDELGRLGQPLRITVSVPSVAHPKESSVAGYWGRPWDPEVQATYLRAFYTLALSKAAVASVTWQDADDAGAEVLGGGLFTSDGAAKPSLAALRGLLASWRTRGRGEVNDAGERRLRGFAGRYIVAIIDPRTRREVLTEARIRERELTTLTVRLPADFAAPPAAPRAP